MRKLQEFEMFKRLILDKHQEKLFSSLPKPNLANLDIIENLEKKSEDTRKASGKAISEEEEEEEEEEKEALGDIQDNEINIAYEGLKKRGRKEKLDKKLIQAFEESVLRSKHNSRRVSTSFNPKILKKMNSSLTKTDNKIRPKTMDKAEFSFTGSKNLDQSSFKIDPNRFKRASLKEKPDLENNLLLGSKEKKGNDNKNIKNIDGDKNRERDEDGDDKRESREDFNI